MTPFSIVVMEVKFKNKLMNHCGFGKRKSLANKACQPLAQGVIPAFNMGSLTAPLANTVMRLGGKNLLIRGSEVQRYRKLL